ncbi:HNH endonuclease [Gordonia sp. SID5947]|uniref:HNH endonuclease signature motif containing protein n=1 Tax=Gordonia sp. SID5947 TaxID=2690315 RepID=UPI00136FB01F|nr:HNH endonuclease signature motif containing protein [Gordonia sp. SID5947]MYR07281.1 HNH endonuclease [Gordonia sp. SID5947]
MFTCSDPDAAEAAIASTSPSELGEAAREHLRSSRRHEARSLLAAHRLGQAVYDDMVMSLSATGQMRVRNGADKAAIGEISLQLGISRTKAGTWFNLGDALQRLPKIRRAYLAGDLSTHRMSTMVYAAQTAPDTITGEPTPTEPSGSDGPEPAGPELANPDLAQPDAVDPEPGDSGELPDSGARGAVSQADADDVPVLDFEDLALELSSRPTTDRVFTDQLADIVISLDPDAATEARHEFADAWQNLTVTADAAGHMNLDACIPAEDGVHLTQRITALIAARICRRDPRRIGQHRVMALAEIIGVPGKTLTCGCGHGNCPTQPPTDPVGPSDAPAQQDPNSDHHTTRDDDTSDDVREEASSDRADEHDPDEDDPDEDVRDDDVSDGGAGEDRAPSLILDLTDPTVPRLRGYGAIDPTLAATLIDHSATHAPTLHAPSDGACRRSSGLIITGRDPAPPVDPTGHGGHTHPQPGALTYRPSRRLRDHILRTDLWCRYPLCAKPSHECELDHLVKFDHADPPAGGWTVALNLIPLCTPDHHRKHQALWTPTMHTDRTITWHNPTTGQDITTHPR